MSDEKDQSRGAEDSFDDDDPADALDASDETEGDRLADKGLDKPKE